MKNETYFCVQEFVLRGRRVWPAKPLAFLSATEAEEEFDKLSQRDAAGIHYEITGDLQSDVWSEPLLLARTAKAASFMTLGRLSGSVSFNQRSDIV